MFTDGAMRLRLEYALGCRQKCSPLALRSEIISRSEMTILNPRLASRRTAAMLILLALSAQTAHAAVESDLIEPAAPVLVAGDHLDGRVFVNGIRRQDEIVVVSTRAVCGTCDPQSLRTGITVERYAMKDDVGYRCWQPSDFESFLAFDPTVPTVIFVHGNQIDPRWAKLEGLELYRRMINCAGDGPPMRLVILSWPSSTISGGLLRNVRVKAARTDSVGCQLAWLVDQMPTETQVTLVGFSLGARVITGGLHILAGGSLGHLSLTERVEPDRAPMNAVLMAAALHSNWLGEGQYHGLAMTQVSQMLLINNRRDPAMRFYHIAFPGRPKALGYCGPTYIAPWQRSKIDMRDVSRYTSQHDLYQYLCVPGVPAQIAEYSLAAPQGALKVASAE
jgi:hypothetical protein